LGSIPNGIRCDHICTNHVGQSESGHGDAHAY